MMPLTLVIFMTQDVCSGLSFEPLSRRPRNAIVTKNTENVLMLYRLDQPSNDSPSKRERPSVSGSFRCGEFGSSMPARTLSGRPEKKWTLLSLTVSCEVQVAHQHQSEVTQ